MPKKRFPPVTVSSSVASEDLLGLYQSGRSILVEYTEVPALITALRRAYNARPGQSQADGVVASVLLQSAVADAPGDFSRRKALPSMGINLEKRSEAATISLTKVLQAAADKGQDLGEVSAQVILVIDYSGSMSPFYASGEVQELAERVLGLSMSGLDDDGNVQVFPFHHEALEPFVVDASNYSGAIDRWRYEEVPVGGKSMFGKQKTRIQERRMGGTEYAAAINAVVQFAKTNGMLNPGQPPVLVVFQTDGGSASSGLDKQLLTKYAELPIFWQFLGLGSDTEFLDVLDNLPNRKIDNVGKCSFPKVSNVPDEQFYDELVSEFLPKWLPEARRLGIITV